VSGDYRYEISATGPDGALCELTVGPVEGAVYYAEYWTGSSPWWKRAWRRILRRR
jgi:hypothetical protein